MKIDSNTEYELFTRHVFERIVNNTAIKPIYVKHDIKLKGKSGQDHQIDVYFEYENYSGRQAVAIECKKYGSMVQIGRVRDFFGVLYDLGDSVKGVMVSKKGFQRGAKRFANYYGISLIQLREVSENEIIGAINTHSVIDKTHHLYQIDEKFASEHNIFVNGIRKCYSQMFPEIAAYWLNSSSVPLETLDSNIYDSNGSIISSLSKLDAITPFKQYQDYFIPFKDAWVNTRAWGLVKINGVKIENETHEQDLTFNLHAKYFVEALIKDVLSNESQYVPNY